MRSQWCREHIKETAENCGLDEETVSRVNKVAKFCTSNPQFCDCGTAAIYRLISVSDESVRQNAISSASKALESDKHPVTGKFLKDKRLTEGDIKQIIDQSFKELHTESPKKPPYNGTPQKPDQTATPPAPIAQTLKEKYAAKMEPATVKESLTAQLEWHCGVSPCPDGSNHIEIEKIRGKVCNLLSLPCDQVTKERCPVLIRQKKAQEQGFVPASDVDPLTGGRFVKSSPIRITKVPMVIEFHPSPKQQEFIQRMIKSGEMDTPEEVVSTALDYAMLQEGGA